MSVAEGRIIEFVRAYNAEHRRPPTIREIQMAMGFRSPRAVSYHIDRLIDLGQIIRKPGPRGLFVPALIANQEAA